MTNDRVVGDTQLVELGQHPADVLVMGHHDIVVVSLAALALVLFRAVRPEVHRGRVVPQEKGFPSLWQRSMKATACSVTSSSMVSMRFLVRGPVSSILFPPLLSAQLCSTPLGPNRFLNSGSFG